jgi:hypothetical protein
VAKPSVRWAAGEYKTVVKIAPRLNTRLKGKDGELVARWIEGGSPE